MENAEAKKSTTPRAKPKPATKVSTGSFSETTPVTKYATAAQVEPAPVDVEKRASADEHAEAIKRLEAEVEALKVKAAEMQQATDQKLKLYVKMQFGAMSLLGMFNIFG
ncbi:hypothetical protein [Zwartia sp.]|uniref:hypothetical protein n=1 Tax=Zwartia sp. TaxID=2978004 RepID=UPI0027240C67|nr:hypothetical protein [Zwartia sp.]MDO9024636.1 hypothetical protein [Zwartia sp.]